MTATGGVVTSFNRRGGVPTVEKAGTGIYNVTFPGSSFTVATAIPLASLIVGPGDIGVGIAAGGAVQVRTYSAGGPADATFMLAVFDSTAG